MSRSPFNTALKDALLRAHVLILPRLTASPSETTRKKPAYLESKSELWVKENLINLGVQSLPHDWEYNLGHETACVCPSCERQRQIEEGRRLAAKEIPELS